MADKIVFITYQRDSQTNRSKITDDSIVMWSIRPNLFTHKEYSRLLDSFDKVISTISFFTRIEIPSNIFRKKRLSILFFIGKNNSLIDKSRFDTRIGIISIRAFSFMTDYTDISKMIRPSGSSSFKRSTIYKWCQ